jgi:D-sedoheptulose 7-phosphate isomerase
MWPQDGASAVREVFARRVAPVEALASNARLVTQACLAMAERFHRGGKLIVFGNGGAGTDAQHVAVEFVHPVIIGKRALPALSLTSDVATLTGVANRTGLSEVFAHQVRTLAEPADIALGISTDGNCANVLRGLAEAQRLGLLTVALVGGGGGAVAERAAAADHVLVARSTDPRVVKEVHVTTYHILWELVHVFLEHPGALPPECSDEVCVTCADQALPVTVVRLLDDEMALVEAGAGGTETVSVALVSAGVGDTVLVHAREAIAVLDGQSVDSQSVAGQSMDRQSVAGQSVDGQSVDRQSVVGR